MGTQIRYILQILSVTLLFCLSAVSPAETKTAYAVITSAPTPVDTERGGTVWTRSFSSTEGRYSYNSDPVICGTVLYVANDTVLYELDKKNGAILRTMILSARTDSVCRMLLINENELLIPLHGGRIECVDTAAMTSKWQSESFGGQSLSSLLFQDGYLYAGTVNMVSGTDTTGIFYCIDTKDGHTQWTYEDKEHPGGYYWSGAAIHDDILYFSGDNGILVAHSPTTDEVYDTISLTETAKIRTGLVYYEKTESLYTASTDGQIYRIPFSAEGNINKEKIISQSAVPAASSTNCTSTPSIWNGRLYIGSMADGYGHLSVLDSSDLSLIYTVCGEQMAEIKSSPLISTGYSSTGNRDQVYVYVTANHPPGGIYYLMDDSTCTSGSLQTLYIPAAAKQFCLSGITADDTGILYYSNDSNTLFAVSEVDISSDLPAASLQPTETPSPSDTGIPAGSTASLTGHKDSPVQANTEKNTKKTKKPWKIQIKKSRKKVTVTWNKQKKTQTIIYIKYRKGKWKKKIIQTKTKYSIMRKKKTTCIRFRSRIRSGSGWNYSGYTKTYRLKGR